MLRLLLWWLILAIVILLAMQLTLQLICTRIDRKKFPPPGKLVDIPGAQMHVCTLGRGTPHVVLESGIAASSINWGPLQAELGRMTTTYSYDRAGFGWSVSQNRKCTLARMADDLHAMLAAMRVPATTCSLDIHLPATSPVLTPTAIRKNSQAWCCWIR